MDWFSWLSRTSLEPSLVYEYGLAFARNELQLEDATHFNHELLQSMGILVAKHRLEILKLAKKEDGSSGAATALTKTLSGAIKRCLKRCLSKLQVFNEQEAEETKEMVTPEPNWYHGRCRGSMMRKHIDGEKGMQRSRTIALSGPLDGRTMHNKMVTGKVLKLSGPLDGKMNERMMYANRSPIMAHRPLVEGRFLGTLKSPRLSSTGPIDGKAMVDNRSPRLSRPLDERVDSPMGYSPYNKAKGDSDCDDDYGLWPTMFEDLKPT
ncbi:hypothetical protein HN51_036342 [Arachis hypogaea]|uniref:SAM domain-containing protein n=1 Tax=Arachis hypogaea TaxID=3818 RepID=A0A445A0I2_ARAHY|nr:uncharacterized protein LOC107634458 [Arachis ipaensis]XP_025641146.1 uncharacterized protein LOC112735954 [Arachis hypogaea]XP_029152784.1 uncharacterized protein LOC114927341 [Arachis hypogaea]QHO01692.1 uncharacterized protein DS421_13g417350 [Arachis hypogaea]RYR19934.1 hypothetical protein Ahy_B03g064897 [Arachis hypogaea]